MHPIPFLVRLVSFAAVLLLVPTPATAAQSVAAFTLTNGLLQLSWQVRSNYDSQLEESANLSTWRKLWPPHPAPLVDGVQTDLLTLVTTQQFYRVAYGLLTNSPVPTTPGNYPLSVVSGGLTRTYRLVIPLTYSATTPAPLAFLLHGHGQTADSFASQHPDLRTIAQASGLLLVFPQSTVSERGTGWVNYDPVPGEPYVDDRQFLLDLLGHLGGALNIDRQRVFAGGFSNGGQMVHYLGARTTNVFAALAAVASSIGGGKGSTNMVYIPPAAVPMPILIVNATNDCARPFWGGTNDSGTLQPAALEAAIQWTTNINACLNPPVLTTNTSVITWAQRPNFANDCPDYNPTSGFVTNRITRSTWLGCTSSVEVVFVTLTDGGHLWPDAADHVGFDANAEVLGFFLRHCRCEAAGATQTLVVPTAPGQHERTFCDQGFWRRFRLMIPTNYTGAAARPVLFTFHGGRQSVADFSATHPDLFAKCNAEGVILVLPEATVHPETGDTLWGDKPFNIVVDDRLFVTNLLEQLDGALNLDRKRTYAAGFSNGGEFTSWLGSTRTGLLAAIAAVGSTTGWVDPATGLLVAAPPPLEPMPVMLVRGTADTQRPFNGSASVFSAAADLSYWASGDACVPPQLITTVGPVTAWHFNNCAGTSEAKLEGVAGLGHEWPEAPGYNASLRVVDFLLLFTRP